MKHIKCKFYFVLSFSCDESWSQEEILPGPIVLQKKIILLESIEDYEDDDVLKQEFLGTLEENMNLGRLVLGLIWATSHLRPKERTYGFHEVEPKKRQKSIRDWTRIL
ncbi:hypothetical protein [Leptospira noguchii]|uniref:hypothetical protein n=1 Tax=Leptospira noguchii TaxID=28182 RepID=UPI001FB7A996|nr:hypothetical protein [Leptospira noguchii]UOG36288.1 hypothetical protein MAL02_19230 [Leptospira noguchii]